MTPDTAPIPGMQIELAIIVGMLFSVGVYMILRRNLIKLIIGLVFISHAANLMIFTAAGIQRGNPPLIDEGQKLPLAPFADPLPQALILTAIVISFGVTAFTVVLFQRVYQSLGTDDVDEMRATDVSS